MVQPKDAFYPINKDKEMRIKVFQTEADQADVDLLKNSFLWHIYSMDHGDYVSKNSLYGLLAQQFCPTVYAMAIDEGEFWTNQLQAFKSPRDKSTSINNIQLSNSLQSDMSFSMSLCAQASESEIVLQNCCQFMPFLCTFHANLCIFDVKIC